jgi:rhodanese-related sulfurtransferase
VRKVLLEGLIVALVGVALAFIANAVSPRGLQLTRDFFGPATAVPADPGSLTNTSGPVAASEHEQLVARLAAKGLQLANSNLVVQLFQDPRRQQGIVLFIDARDDAHYQAGHIPGAYQLDYYHPEKHLGTVLPLCQVAEQIVLYCNGGQCEDSELAAMFLASAGVPKEKLLVYGGGIAEWGASGAEVETGERGSGQMQAKGAK